MMRADKIIILAIIGVLAIVVFYVIGEHKIIGNEASALGALRKIKAAETVCRTSKGYYTDLPGLYKNEFLLLKIKEGEYSGYIYQITVPNRNSWYVQAKPVKYKSTGVRTFFVDTSGKILMKDNDGEYVKDPSETSDWEPLIKKRTDDAPSEEEAFDWEGRR